MNDNITIDFDNNIEIIKQEIDSLKSEIKAAKNSYEIDLLRNKFTGKTSNISKLFAIIPKLSIDEKRNYVPKLQVLFKEFQNVFLEHENLLNKEPTPDIYLPVYNEQGHKNVLSKTIQEVKSILEHMKFKFINAPEIDEEYNNFDVLNIGLKHPARSLSDTFFSKNNKILRTHTTNMQHLILSKYSEGDYYTVGRVFRNDSDSTHMPMFHQIDCLRLNKSLPELFNLVGKLFADFFQKDIKIRLRNSYFPFTSPSYEIDILLNGKWLEIGGMGMVHPNVLKNCNSKVQYGCALGFGVDRLCMIKNDISDIRKLFTI